MPTVKVKVGDGLHGHCVSKLWKAGRAGMRRSLAGPLTAPTPEFWNPSAGSHPVRRGVGHRMEKGLPRTRFLPLHPLALRPRMTHCFANLSECRDGRGRGASLGRRAPLQLPGIGWVKQNRLCESGRKTARVPATGLGEAEIARPFAPRTRVPFYPGRLRPPPGAPRRILGAAHPCPPTGPGGRSELP